MLVSSIFLKKAKHSNQRTFIKIVKNSEVLKMKDNATKKKKKIIEKFSILKML